MATVKTEPDSGGCSHLQTSRQICKVSSERKVCSEARAQPTHPVPPILRAHLNWQRPFNSRPNYLLSGFVDILVGPEKKDFGVHKGLICPRLKYFQAALNGSFSETSSGVIGLPEDIVVVFKIVHA
ncbi:hypothetical protein ABVK25_009531 [Lepraria finkii]|uniref:BTB domain-containing protein n=1 Tax=Lepraria finkii TaxID=1340010 RepID=A0ABR4AXH0_9LECA